MAERSDEIRHEIEETRERMGDTVEAIGYKADVPSRTKEWVGDKKDAVVSRVSGAAPDRQAVTQKAGRMKTLAEQNPLSLAVGGAALGFLAGVVLPATRVENERIGPVADQVKSSATDAGQEALDRGKEIAQEATRSAAQTAKEKGREQSEELSSTVREKAKDVSPGT